MRRVPRVYGQHAAPLQGQRVEDRLGALEPVLAAGSLMGVIGGMGPGCEFRHRQRADGDPDRKLLPSGALSRSWRKRLRRSRSPIRSRCADLVGSAVYPSATARSGVTVIDAGMNIDEVRDLADQLKRASREIDAIVRVLNRQVPTSPWKGPDSIRFRREWWPRHRTALQAIGTSLDGFGQSAANNAEEQRRASRADTGPSILSLIDDPLVCRDDRETVREALRVVLAGRHLSYAEGQRLRALATASDFEIGVLTTLIRHGASAFDLWEVLHGAHVIINSGDPYESWARASDLNNRSGRLPLFPFVRENSHHLGDREPGSNVFGKDGPFLGEVLFGKLSDGTTWLQLERTSIDTHNGDLLQHGIDYYEYTQTGQNIGPWGTSSYNDSSVIYLY